MLFNDQLDGGSGSNAMNMTVYFDILIAIEFSAFAAHGVILTDMLFNISKVITNHLDI